MKKKNQFPENWKVIISLLRFWLALTIINSFSLFFNKNTSETILIEKCFHPAISIILFLKQNCHITWHYYALSKIQSILSVKYSRRKIYNLNWLHFSLHIIVKRNINGNLLHSMDKHRLHFPLGPLSPPRRDWYYLSIHPVYIGRTYITLEALAHIMRERRRARRVRVYVSVSVCVCMRGGAFVPTPDVHSSRNRRR